MGIREREERRKGVVGALISQPPTQMKKPSAAQEDGKVQRAYYLDPKVAKALKIAAAESGVSASAIVELALQQYLGIQ